MRRALLPLPAAVSVAAIVALLAAGGLLHGAVAARENPREEEPTLPVDSFDADRATAAEAGLEIDRVPEEISAETLPDLVPVELDDGRIAYARSKEVFVEVYDPDAEFLGYGVYEADGETLLGHVIGGKGFVPGDEPRQTSRPAVVPELP